MPEAAQFVAREKELEEMHWLLYGHKSRSVAVLHGLGGVGKTQLAMAYINRHKEKYTTIFWLNANDEDSLRLSFRNIAQQVLEHDASSSHDLDQSVNATKAWLNLQGNARWLLVYDNYDNPRTPGNTNSSAVDLRPFLPASDQGSIIITTRSSQVSHGKRIHIQKLPRTQEGLEILSNTSGRKGIEEDPDAVKLVEELDGLPLALSTAGAYLEQVTMSFTEYLRLYKESWLKLQQTSPQLSSYGEDRSLYSTWQITFDRIEQHNPGSAKLLKLWACFDRQDVWFELLRHASSSDEEWLRELTEDELSFNKAIRLLRDYGLVDADSSLRQSSGSGGYSVHSCVHSWMVFVLNKSWDESLARLALHCIAAETHETSGPKKWCWWLVHRRLLPHVLRCKHLINDKKVNIEGMYAALHNLGSVCKSQEKLTEAEALYSLALYGKEKTLGPMHVSTLDTIHAIGIVCDQQSNLAKAEAMYARACHGYAELCGPLDILTLNANNDLGVTYVHQGNLAKAESTFIRTLQACEQTLGQKHMSTLDVVNNLGGLYFEQGRLAEAENMFCRALEGTEENFGPETTEALLTVTNLADIYKAQGRGVEAEAMYKRGLSGLEKTLGPKHVSTLVTVQEIGDLYRRQGKLGEAETMLNRALKGLEVALGPMHRHTLKTFNSLGLLNVELQKLTVAETLFERAVRGFESMLGVDFTSTSVLALQPVRNLGDLFFRTNRKDMAKVMYSRALSGFAAAQGSSSETCQYLESRLRALQTETAETCGNTSLDSGDRESGPLVRRNLRKRKR